jgi:ribose transport system substrate-binding protein
MRPHKASTGLLVRTVLTVLMLLGSLLQLAGCTPSTPPATPFPLIQQTGTAGGPAQMSSTLRIALVMKTLTNPFFVEMEKGARQAEKELNIQLIVKTAAQETSIEQQIEIVEELVKEKVDAIVIAPGDSVSLIPILKKAREAGIVIVNIDNHLDGPTTQKMGLLNVPYISVDNQKGAYLSAKYVSDQIAAPAQAAILEGIRTAQNAADRLAGARQAFGENPNLQIVASDTAHWKIDEAYEKTRAIFADYPQIKVMFCANDMMALGAIKYLQESGRSGRVLVAAYDALDEAKQAIRDGSLAATIDQQAALQGYKGVQYAVRMRDGESMPAETMVDVSLVTAKTLP